jgi:group I intron endonuclease
MTIGIYSIKAPSGNQYIGQSINCERRLKEHVYKLRKNHHHNTSLQRAYEKYGTALVFKIECELPREHLDEFEQLAIDMLEGKCYNQSPVIARGFISPEYRARVSANTKVMWQDSTHRVKTSKAIATARARPEVQETHRVSSLLLWQDPTHRAKMIKARLKVTTDPKFKAKRKILATKMWENPEHINKVRAGLAVANNKPSTKDKRVAGGKTLWQRPEHKAKMTAGYIERLFTKVRDQGILLLSIEGISVLTQVYRRHFRRGIEIENKARHAAAHALYRFHKTYYTRHHETNNQNQDCNAQT